MSLKIVLKIYKILINKVYNKERKKRTSRWVLQSFAHSLFQAVMLWWVNQKGVTTKFEGGQRSYSSISNSKSVRSFDLNK